MWSKPQCLVLDEPTNFLDRDALGGLAVGIREWEGAFICISHNQEFIGALCSVRLTPLSSLSERPLTSPFFPRSQEIWNVEAGRLTHKGKASVDDKAFESNPNSARDTPIGTPGVATPAETPVGSGDEARATATVEGAEEELKFKAAKGRKKLTRKQLKEREDRRRARTLAFLSSTVPGAVREPDTEDEDEEHEKQKLVRRLLSLSPLLSTRLGTLLTSCPPRRAAHPVQEDQERHHHPHDRGSQEGGRRDPGLDRRLDPLPLSSFYPPAGCSCVVRFPLGTRFFRRRFSPWLATLRSPSTPCRNTIECATRTLSHPHSSASASD